MISSKKITLIALFLIALAVGGLICAMLWQSSLTVATIGTISYSDTHTVSFTADDYYTDYAALGVSKITLSGNTASSTSKNVSVSEGEITIQGGGTYVLFGEYNGSIIVDSADSAEVRLVLNNANVTSSDFSALYIKQAEKTVLSSVAGTKNSFTDAEAYNEEMLTEGKPDAAIYSKDDLTINGEGTLTITGNYADGLKVNDGLKITEGSIKITAADEGINANDYIALLAASVEVYGSNDAIKCEHEDADKGFVVLEGTTLSLSGGMDDGLYASSSIYMKDALVEIEAGGDAVHAGKDAILASKTLNITRCTEGIEGAYIEINSGDICITATDDGINAVGENSMGGFGRPMGMHKENITEEEIYLVINGGTIEIHTGGDGVDSNGAVRVNGGNVTVYGPENNGNSSLDFEYGFLIDGGSLLAAGSSGMAETPSESSKQNSIVFYLEETFDGESLISLTDNAGNVLLSGTSNKRFDWMCVSAPTLTQGETYTLIINGNEIISAKATDVVTTSGSRERSGFTW